MVYIHVPFCRSFCTYCDFYSELCRKPGASKEGSAVFYEYSAALIEEIGRRKDEIALNMAGSPATLYIGGGTPSVLPLDVLDPLVGAVEAAVGDSFQEFTVEVNPEDIVEKGIDYVCGLIALGVDRISMGVQSFDDGILRWMNRRHTAQRAKEAFDIIRRAEQLAGKRRVSVSVDLIFGLSQLSDELWDGTISGALSLGEASGFRGPEHISAYQLSIEEGSALARMVSKGLYEEASEEQCRRQYDLLCRRLSEAGFRHYEISNFALPGFEAVHNSAYWKRLPYIGLGPGAHSLTMVRPEWLSGLPGATPEDSSGNLEQVEEGLAGSLADLGAAASCPVSGLDAMSGGLVEIRSWNSQKLPTRDGSGTLEAYSRSFEILSAEDRRVEELMLALRTDEGLDAARACSLASLQTIDRLLQEGALELFVPRQAALVSASGLVHPLSAGDGAVVPDRERLRIPESRLFTSDEILREIL